MSGATQLTRAIQCRPNLPARRSVVARANMLAVANVCMMLLPFLLLCSPSDMLRVFNIGTQPPSPTAQRMLIRISNHGLALTMGPSMLASGPHPAHGAGLPAQVADTLVALAHAQPDVDIVVQPDASATYADVLGVLDALHALPALSFDGSTAARSRHIVLVPSVSAPPAAPRPAP